MQVHNYLGIFLLARVTTTYITYMLYINEAWPYFMGNCCGMINSKHDYQKSHFFGFNLAYSFVASIGYNVNHLHKGLCILLLWMLSLGFRYALNFAVLKGWLQRVPAIIATRSCSINLNLWLVWNQLVLSNFCWYLVSFFSTGKVVWCLYILSVRFSQCLQVTS